MCIYFFRLGGKPMARNLTSFMFFKNTPLTDYQNTIHFSSNAERDNYFLKGGHFPAINYDAIPFNFIRDRSVINLEQLSWNEAQGINYCTFKSDFEDRRYYAFVNQIEYVNDKVTRLYLVIDTVMTFTQGNVLSNVGGAFIERQHLPKAEYERILPYLRNNDDILKASNKYYIANYLEQFGTNYVMFQSSADLTKKFGTKKEPNLDTSKGATYDIITSPVNLYIMGHGNFINFMDKMSKYPWITQNFQKVQMIPRKFINRDDLIQIEATESDIKGMEIFTLKSGGKSVEWTLNNLTVPFSTLQKWVSIDRDSYKHLIRNEYFTIECYDWNGGNMLLDAGKITEETGIKFKTKSIVGYHNEVRVYPVDYNKGEVEQPILGQDGTILIDTGSFLNTSLVYNDFAEVPVLIDNGILGQSQQANKMANSERQLIGNRVKNIATGDDIKSKFMDAASIASSVSPGALFSKFNEEYDFYNQQKADYADMALQPPSVTSSAMGNAFPVANSINGMTMKIAVPSPYDMERLMAYYNRMGFEVNKEFGFPEPLDTWTVCNYLRMRGTYTIDGIDPSLMNMLKALLESGVRFWHNDGTNNPLVQNIYDNTFRK